MTGSMNEFVEWVAREWPEGVCRFCGVLDTQVDGDRLRWVTARRNVCSGPGCARRFRVEIARAEQRIRATRRRRTPADIHELKLKEARQRRQASRQRRKGKAA